MIKLKEAISTKRQWDELNSYIRLIEENQYLKSNIALDGAKSLLESISKTILNNKGVDFKADESISKLIKMTFDTLPVSKALEKKDADSTKAILNAFGTIVGNIGEFRNRHGFFSHGQDVEADKFDKYLTDLVISSAELVASFLITTHAEDLEDRSRLYYDDYDNFNRYVDDNTETPEVLGATLIPSIALFTDKEAYKVMLNEFINDKKQTILTFSTLTCSMFTSWIEDDLENFSDYYNEDEAKNILTIIFDNHMCIEFDNEYIEEFLNQMYEISKKVLPNNIKEFIEVKINGEYNDESQ